MILKPKIKDKIPIEAECISPDNFEGKNLHEIKNLEVFYGNKKKRLSDFFDVSGDSEEIIIDGDVSLVKYIGYKMTKGKIVVRGNAGMHLGAEMKGGKILVEGNVSDWCGAEMKGGEIWIKGNAKNYLGAAYRGSKWGMNRGLIVCEGSCGNEVGFLMKRGTIVIYKNTGEFAGSHMKGGTIVCFGNFGERVGAQMNRGTLIAYNPPKLLKTFCYNSIYNPTWLRFFLKDLKNLNLPVQENYITGLYERYNGDITELGKGEILVFKG